MQLYKNVLSTAWHHTIHRPGLWMFGLFATFIFGNGGEIDRYLRFMNAVVSEGHILNPLFWLNHRWAATVSNLTSQLVHGNVQVWLFVGLIFVALVWVVMMMSIAAGALISSTINPRHTFVEAFQSGARHTVDLFFLFVGGYMVIAVGTFVLGAVLFSFGFPHEQAQQLFSIVGSVVFIPLVIVLSFIIRYAAISIVIDNHHLLSAVREACKVLRQHWLVTIEMAIVNFVVVLVVNLAVLLSVGILFAPQYYASVWSIQTGTFFDRLATAVVTSGLVYVVITIFVGALVSTWQWTAWTLLFQRLRQSKPDSTLLRWLRFKRR